MVTENTVEVFSSHGCIKYMATHRLVPSETNTETS